MLPSDFEGPPAANVGGTVTGSPAAKDAGKPRLSMAWLVGMDEGSPALVGQAVSYQRSAKLQSDWDIGLAAPTETARWSGAVGARQVRLAVGKMVYFDDRVADERLDWACQGAACDQVKAVSRQFVVFVEAPLYCQPREGIPARPKILAGYHYYSLDGAVARELGRDEAVSFDVQGGDRALVESNPTEELETFVHVLLRQWAANPISGC